MTRRENLLQTLKHQKHDRLPAYVVIDNFNYPQPLPEGFDIQKITSFTDNKGFIDPKGVAELSKYFGMDTLMRITPSLVRTEYDPSQATIRTESLENGAKATIYETPVGKIKSVSKPSAEANTVFMVEHPIKQLTDYDIYLSYLKSQKFFIDEQNILESKQHLQAINDEGIAYVVGPATPIMDLARVWVGLEKFIYHLMDDPNLIKSVLDAMAENCYRQYELIAENSVCEAIVFWDDSNSLYLTPEMFEQYSIPVMRRFADIAHKHDKILVCHTCGKIKAFLNLFSETGVDVVDWVTPSPTGDIDPKLVQDIWGDKIAVMLAVLPNVMRNGTPDQVEAHIHSLLRGLDLKKNLILMIAPPGGTPLENLRRAVQILTNEYGVPLNSSDRFGNILDSIENPVWTTIRPSEVPH
jgi:hypothetical protein